MELTIRADDAEAAGTLRTALESGQFEVSEASEPGETAIGVVAAAEDASSLAAALSVWLQHEPPGSELTVETGTQTLTVHAGDPRAAIALTEAVIRASRAAQE